MTHTPPLPSIYAQAKTHFYQLRSWPNPSTCSFKQNTYQLFVKMPRRKKPSKPKTIKKWVKKTNWLDLPADITANILQRLGPIEILESAQKVCTAWRTICKDPAMWRVIDMQNHGDLCDLPYDLDIMCRHAIDRSQGQLVDINIEYFGNDELMEYLAQGGRYCISVLSIDPYLLYMFVYGLVLL